MESLAVNVDCKVDTIHNTILLQFIDRTYNLEYKFQYENLRVGHLGGESGCINSRAIATTSTSIDSGGFLIR